MLCCSIQIRLVRKFGIGGFGYEYKINVGVMVKRLRTSFKMLQTRIKKLTENQRFTKIFFFSSVKL